MFLVSVSDVSVTDITLSSGIQFVQDSDFRLEFGLNVASNNGTNFSSVEGERRNFDVTLMLTDADLSKGEKDSLALDVLEPDFETSELQVSYELEYFSSILYCSTTNLTSFHNYEHWTICSSWPFQCRDNIRVRHENSNTFENHLNPVMLVFIG